MDKQIRKYSYNGILPITKNDKVAKYLGPWKGTQRHIYRIIEAMLKHYFC